MLYFITNVCDDHYNTESGCIIMFCAQDNFELYEQKPAETVKWSSQEESYICQLESLVKEQWRQAERVHNSVIIKKMSELMFFLKTLNPNKKPQRIISAEVKEAMYDKPAWSEEDNKMSRFIGNAITVDGASIYLESKGIQVIDAHVWLEELKERVQPKQEWSEEDKEIIETICEEGDLKPSERVWLKLLKERYTWMPSDEQMLAINTAINVLGKGTINGKCLIELQEQLKKLMEK